jgi:hypothetical protein
MTRKMMNPPEPPDAGSGASVDGVAPGSATVAPVRASTKPVT